MRQLVYGVSPDLLDESLRMAGSTGRECLRRFVAAILQAFGERYLRQPNAQDVQRLLAENEARGFAAMLGSLDCMHWFWKKSPTAWAGQYTGKERKPKLIPEAVASQDVYIWHAFLACLEHTMTLLFWIARRCSRNLTTTKRCP